MIHITNKKKKKKHDFKKDPIEVQKFEFNQLTFANQL